MTCFMCTLDAGKIVASNDLAVAFLDGFPVSTGHMLVVTRRHVETWFDATEAEQLAVLELVDQVKTSLDNEFHPDGFNIGFNVGEAAGQTISHFHVHVIPRFAGDVDDPSGGVRLVVPDKGNYRRPGFVPSSRRRKRVKAN